jgi:ubiquinone/menaquinone biosynthesis C-methylase UbiE
MRNCEISPRRVSASDNRDRDAVFELPATIATWDAGYYHPIALPFYDLAIARMIDVMGVPRGATVLDAGCGPGEQSIRVARLGRRVHAIDVSKAMLQEARRRAEAAGVGDMVQFQRQDLTRLDLPDSSFRHVFSWGVIIHIREIDEALDGLARVVEPGGTLALWVTNASAIDYMVERIARRLLRKPLAGLSRFEPGDGVSYEFQGERLWVWRLEQRWLVNTMMSRGFRLRRRLMGSLTETHTRLKGLARDATLRLNNVALRLGGPVSVSATNLFVFERTA